MRNEAEPNQEFSKERVKRKSQPGFTYRHQRNSDVLGAIPSLIPNSITSHLTNNDIVWDVVLLAKVLVLLAEIVGMGANLTPLIEVGHLSVLGWGFTVPGSFGSRGSSLGAKSRIGLWSKLGLGFQVGGLCE